MTVTSVIDPASSALTAAHYNIPAGQKAVMMRSSVVFTAAYTGPIGQGFEMWSHQGLSSRPLVASTPDCQPFPFKAEAGITVSGCDVFLVGADVKPVSVTWAPSTSVGQKPAGETLTWSL